MNDELKEQIDIALLILGKRANTMDVIEFVKQTHNIEGYFITIMCHLSNIRARL